VRDLFARFGARPAAGLSPDQVRPAVRVRRYIDAHYAELVRIDALADVAGQSPCHVIHAFTRQFGMPPYTYLTQVRVARACELLREGRQVSDTAFAVGFHDQSHLTRFFKRIVGVPPGLFARAVASRAAPPATRRQATAATPPGMAARA
jgi:AraC-like DNA-binding protein